MFCPRCMTCQQPIVDKCVNANGKKYHPHHFACTGISFPPKFFYQNLSKKKYRKKQKKMRRKNRKKIKIIFLNFSHLNFFIRICQKKNSKKQKKNRNFFFLISSKKISRQFFFLGCGKNLVGKSFKFADDDVYCTECKPLNVTSSGILYNKKYPRLTPYHKDRQQIHVLDANFQLQENISFFMVKKCMLNISNVKLVVVNSEVNRRYFGGSF